MRLGVKRSQGFCHTPPLVEWNSHPQWMMGCCGVGVLFSGPRCQKIMHDCVHSLARSLTLCLGCVFLETHRITYADDAYMCAWCECDVCLVSRKMWVFSLKFMDICMRESKQFGKWDVVCGMCWWVAFWKFRGRFWLFSHLLYLPSKTTGFPCTESWCLQCVWM